jgi:hypothetical protein
MFSLRACTKFTYNSGVSGIHWVVAPELLRWQRRSHKNERTCTKFMREHVLSSQTIAGRSRWNTGPLIYRYLMCILCICTYIYKHICSSLAFYWHSKKVSGPPLCPSRLTKKRTYRPRSVIYRYVSRQSSEKWFKPAYSSYPLSILRGQLNKWCFIRKGKLPQYENFPMIFEPVL